MLDSRYVRLLSSQFTLCKQKGGAWETGNEGEGRMFSVRTIQWNVQQINQIFFVSLEIA